jgi:hypothetical protein
MIEHLSLISQATAKDRQALVIVDRAGWHMTKAIRCFSNVTLLPLPQKYIRIQIAADELL